MKNKKILWEEKNLRNNLHPQGKQLLLCSAFLRESSPLALPDSWYIGLDNRSAIGKGDTLKEVCSYEPKSKDYVRLPILEGGGFEWFWRESKDEENSDPPEFTVNASVEFVPTEEWGIVRNFFLASVKEGTDGILVSSVPLKKARDMDDETSFTVECSLSLSDNKQINNKK